MTVVSPGPGRQSADPQPAIEFSGPARARFRPAGAGYRPGQLSVWTHQSADHCTLRLRGSLGAETLSVLDRHVDLLACCSCEEIIVDLAGLEMLDPVGARLIAGLAHYVAGRGGTLSVTGASREMKALLADAEVHLAG